MLWSIWSLDSVFGLSGNPFKAQWWTIDSREIISFVAIVHVLVFDDFRVGFAVFSGASESKAHENQKNQKYFHLELLVTSWSAKTANVTTLNDWEASRLAQHQRT